MSNETEERTVPRIVNDVKRLAEKIKPLIDETPQPHRLTAIGFALTTEAMTQLSEALDSQDRDNGRRIVFDLMNVCANIAANISQADPSRIVAFCDAITHLALDYSGAEAPRKPMEPMYA